jgi:hypothetical protein
MKNIKYIFKQYYVIHYIIFILITLILFIRWIIKIDVKVKNNKYLRMDGVHDSLARKTIWNVLFMYFYMYPGTTTLIVMHPTDIFIILKHFSKIILKYPFMAPSTQQVPWKKFWFLNMHGMK